MVHDNNLELTKGLSGFVLIELQREIFVGRIVFLGSEKVRDAEQRTSGDIRGVGYY